MDNTTFNLDSSVLMQLDDSWLEECLTKLRNNFLELRKSLLEKTQQVDLLNKRCNKLSNVIKDQRNKLNSQKPGKLNYEWKPDSQNPCDTSKINCDDEIPLFNEKLSQSTFLNDARHHNETLESTMFSPNGNERIAETENVLSPRILRGNRLQGEHDLSHSLKEHNINQPYMKERRKIFNDQSSTWCMDFLQPKNKQRKSPCLSLKKRKVRQTQLKLQPKTLSSTEEVGALKKSKTFSICDEIKKEKDDDLFNFPTANLQKRNYCLHSLSSGEKQLAAKQERSSSQSSDVIEIPLATQEVIFLDDSIENSNSDHERKVKVEKETTSKVDKISELENNKIGKRYTNDHQNQKLSIKKEYDDSTQTPNISERFPTDCVDCKMYLQMFGHKKSEREIEEHLRKCTHRERSLTPPNFWNPLIESFPEDDPRNETLIDSRFPFKKRI